MSGVKIAFTVIYSIIIAVFFVKLIFDIHLYLKNPYRYSKQAGGSFSDVGKAITDAAGEIKNKYIYEYDNYKLMNRIGTDIIVMVIFVVGIIVTWI